MLTSNALMGGNSKRWPLTTSYRESLSTDLSSVAIGFMVHSLSWFGTTTIITKGGKL